MINSNKGYTLIELMIVTAMITLLSVSVYKIRTENSIVQKNMLLRQKAIWSLESQADIMKSYVFEDLKTGEIYSFDSELIKQMNFRGALGNVRIEEISGKLKKIFLEITWPDARQVKQKLTLIVFRYNQ